MKKIAIFLLLPFLFWSCKEISKGKKQSLAPLETVTDPLQKTNPTLQELLQFAEISQDETTLKDGLLKFKVVDKAGNSTSMDWDKGLALFESFPKDPKRDNFPVMEIKDSDRVIIMFKGKGFGGPIWAMLLIDRKTDEILKIKFGHKAETDGYGAEIVRTSFQDQFIGKTLKGSTSTFGLDRSGTKTNEGIYLIDGISGATVTNKGVVEMMNNGLTTYAKYLEQE